MDETEHEIFEMISHSTDHRAALETAFKLALEILAQYAELPCTSPSSRESSFG